jgi:cyclophilin family peptidyl-prolyl cis-trans isomerase
MQVTFSFSRTMVAALLTLLTSLTALLCPTSAAATTVRLQTTQGAIDINLYDAAAPITVTNFLAYVRSGAYNDSLIHRSVRGFVIQGGGFVWNAATNNVDSIVTRAPIQNEFSPARSNMRGTIAMAKLEGNPNSATSQWFINLANNAAILDGQNGGFTVFGEVTPASMAVVDAIAALEIRNAGGAFAELPLTSIPSNGQITKANLSLVQTATARSATFPDTIDIDGTGRHNIVLRNSSTIAAPNPQMRVARLVNSQFQFAVQDDPGVAFRLVGVADLDANGKSDLVFLNAEQAEFGDVRIWTDFQRANERLWRQVKQVWDVQVAGDLDGDGAGDVVWRYLAPDPRDTGVSYIWFYNGTAAPIVRKRGGAPLDWTLLGAGDFDLNGAADMVYVSPDNQVRVLMATPNRTCANVSAGVLPAGFRAIKVGNFNGNGRGVLLLRNASTGQTLLRTLSAAGLVLPSFNGDPNDPNVSCTSTTLVLSTSDLSLLPTDAGWQFYAAGDFNGDGVFDVVWLRPDGTLTLWLLNDGTGFNAPVVIDNAGTAPIGFSVFQPGGSGATHYGPAAASSERAVAPAATDVAINLALDAHFAINPSPSVAAARKLFVFLPGTGAVAQNYRLILRAGAARGYHAIGLNYPNEEAIGSLCNDDADVDCHGKAREEVVTGVNLSTKVDVNRANSIVNRLLKLLTYLDARFPTEGWGQFIVAGQPAWQKITMAGHSQGGGHAALMAKLYTMDRAVFFSAPADWRNQGQQPATWVTARPNTTSVARQYGFAHLRDTLVPYNTRIVPIWEAIGLGAFGAAVSVDVVAAPFANSRQLTTNAEPATFAGVVSPAHNATAVDASTPRAADGSPLFTPVWNYLAFPLN